MDNFQLWQCAKTDTNELRRIYAGVLTIDDVTHMNKSIENFRQFLISALLRKNCSIINTFPIGFVVNTGSHKSGGIHWQGTSSSKSNGEQLVNKASTSYLIST